MALKEIKDAGLSAFRSKNKRKLILVITALFGFPTLSFSSYIFFAQIPLAFIDASTAVNFFLSFYIALIFSIALARIITFFMEVIYRTSALFFVLPKRRRKSKVTASMNSWGEKVRASESLSIDEFGDMAKSLFRYERVRLNSKMLLDRKAKKIFQDLNSYFIIAPLSFYILSFIFLGSLLTFILSMLYIGLTFISIISFNDAETELEGIIVASIGRVAYDHLKKDSNQQRIEFGSKPENLVHIEVPSRSFNNLIKSIYSDFKNTSLSGLKANLNLLKNDFSILTFSILLLGVAAGISKYMSDVTLKVNMATEFSTPQCVSPLLITSNHMVLYYHAEGEVLIVPYEKAHYNRGADC